MGWIPGSPSTRGPRRAIFARWGEGTGLRRWGGYRGPHRLGVPGERFLLAGVKGQVFVDGVDTGVPIDSGSPATRGPQQVIFTCWGEGSDFCSLG